MHDIHQFTPYQSNKIMKNKNSSCVFKFYLLIKETNNKLLELNNHKITLFFGFLDDFLLFFGVKFT